MQPHIARILTHVSFEHEGALAEILPDFGFSCVRSEAVHLDWESLSPLEDALWIVAGGPIGVYETANYPFLRQELHHISTRLRAGKPVLGICLGAQLIAEAAVGRVFPGTAGKELGWAALTPGPDVARHPWVLPLLQTDLNVLHWHGDTFDLPPGSALLASTERYPNQAFLYKERALGLQFHAEVTPAVLEDWYVGHANELSAQGINIPQLRRQGTLYCTPATQALQQVIAAWLMRCGYSPVAEGPELAERPLAVSGIATDSKVKIC